MKLLAVDTATEACSVALYIDGALHCKTVTEPRAHARVLLPMIDQLLAEAELKPSQLDRLACGIGPGGFTGVRIGVAMVQGIAAAADLAVTPISDLAALALGAWRKSGQRNILCAFDARMGELYYAAYCVEDSGCQVVEHLADQVVAPDKLPLPTEGAWFATGSGWQIESACEQVARASLSCDFSPQVDYPNAEDIAVLAVHSCAPCVAASDLAPVYLRNNVAQTIAERNRIKNNREKSQTN